MRKYSKSFAVYLLALTIGGVTIGPLTSLLEHLAQVSKGAPCVAGAILTAVTVVMSFFGHKHISFRVRSSVPLDCSRKTESNS